MSVKIIFQRDLCTGHGRCYALAPEVYGADDEGYCVVLESEIPAHLIDQANLGARNCPEDALSVVDGTRG